MEPKLSKTDTPRVKPNSPLTDASALAPATRKDIAYYTAENVTADLSAFAKAAGKESIRELTAGRSDTAVYAKCADGELVRFPTYLANAAVGLRLCRNSSQGKLLTAKTLEQLKVIAGCEVPKFKDRDFKYFSDRHIVRADLLSFCLATGAKSIADLNTGPRFMSSEAKSSTGELVKFKTYVAQAGVTLRIAESVVAAKEYLIGPLCYLKWRADVRNPGYPIMDETYFSKPNRVRMDLGAFASRLGLEDASELKLEVKTAYKPVLCCNGEQVSLLAYVARAGHAFDLLSSNFQEDLAPDSDRIMNRLFALASEQA